MKDNESPPKKSRKKPRRLFRHDEKPAETIGSCFAWRKNPLAVKENVPPGEIFCRELWQPGSWFKKSAEGGGYSVAKRDYRKKYGLPGCPAINFCFFSWRWNRIPKFSKK